MTASHRGLAASPRSCVQSGGGPQGQRRPVRPRPRRGAERPDGCCESSRHPALRIASVIGTAPGGGRASRR
eukprot:9333519-Alexandrium_andersonii.AAC.1